MYFQHSAAMWAEFPGLVPGVLRADGVTAGADVSAAVARLTEAAAVRLAGRAESELPEIQAWRRVFAQLGYKPTQYRCAAEALLRRFRKDGSLPRLHPLIDLCNAASLAFAIPVAVFDLGRLAGGLEVRRAAGTEDYLTFGGETEHPAPDEVIFADEAGRAHARRWTNRQSAWSGVTGQTTSALIVAEALHPSAAADVTVLAETLRAELDAAWTVPAKPVILTADAPRLEF